MKNDTETKTMKASELFRGEEGVFEVRVIEAHARQAYGLYFDLYKLGEMKTLTIVDFIVMETDAYTAMPAALMLSKDATNILMADLWRLGVRPKEDHTTSEIEALSRHLEDMRAIAANKLKVNLPARG